MSFCYVPKFPFIKYPNPCGNARFIQDTCSINQCLNLALNGSHIRDLSTECEKTPFCLFVLAVTSPVQRNS